MQFVYPSFLWAFALLLIPIIIHLFHFRRFKTVYFTNVRFLKEIKEETSSRSKIKNLLTLLMRLLAFSFLILAFAQPIISKNKTINSGRKAISLFIDNSFSMEAKKDGVQLLTKAKLIAHQIVSEFNDADLFQILTHDFEGRHQILVNKEDALGLIDEIKMSPKVQMLNSVVKRQKNALESKPDLYKSIYILSDFQKSIVNGKLKQDSLIPMTLVPIRTNQLQNLSIDSAWFNAPVQIIGQTNTLYIKVSNRSEKDVDNVRLSIDMNQQERPINTLNIPAGQSVVDTFSLLITKAGWQTAKLKITDFPIQYDDEYFISYNVPEKIKILILNEGKSNHYLESLFNGISGFEHEYSRLDNINYASLSNYNQIVIHDINNISSGLSKELVKYIDGGGNVFLFPGSSISLDSYNQFLNSIQAGKYSKTQRRAKEVGKINKDEFIFSDVFIKDSETIKLPQTNSNYKLTSSGKGYAETIMNYRDGSTFLLKINHGNGRIYLCDAPIELEYNDLVKHAEIFVPLMYKMALAKSNQIKLSQTIGTDEILSIVKNDKNQDEVFHLQGQGVDIIPAQIHNRNLTQLTIGQSIASSGFYDVTLLDEIFGRFAFNYDRKESDIQMLDKSTLENTYTVLDEISQNNVSTYIAEKEGGKPLWTWVLIIALICLALEEIILRFWKS